MSYQKTFSHKIKQMIKNDFIFILLRTEVNPLHAGCIGVSNALPLIANIAGNLIAFIAFITFFNAVFDWGCQLLNYEEGTCSFEVRKNIIVYYIYKLTLDYEF